MPVGRGPLRSLYAKFLHADRKIFTESGERKEVMRTLASSGGHSCSAPPIATCVRPGSERAAGRPRLRAGAHKLVSAVSAEMPGGTAPLK